MWESGSLGISGPFGTNHTGMPNHHVVFAIVNAERHMSPVAVEWDADVNPDRTLNPWYGWVLAVLCGWEPVMQVASASQTCIVLHVSRIKAGKSHTGCCNRTGLNLFQAGTVHIKDCRDIRLHQA